MIERTGKCSRRVDHRVCGRLLGEAAFSKIVRRFHRAIPAHRRSDDKLHCLYPVMADAPFAAVGVTEQPCGGEEEAAPAPHPSRRVVAVEPRDTKRPCEIPDIGAGYRTSVKYLLTQGPVSAPIPPTTQNRGLSELFSPSRCAILVPEKRFLATDDTDKCPLPAPRWRSN